MRPALLALALVFLASTHTARAEVRLGDEPLRALAVDQGDGQALAVTDSTSRTRPFRLWRSGGDRARRLSPFGSVRGETPDIAATDEGAAVAWAVPISGGARLAAAAIDGATVDAPAFTLFGTGPPRLALSDGVPLLAFPDRTGDAAVGGAVTATLTGDAPERRHLPMDVGSIDGRPIVLDLVQRPGLSQLVVRGPGAPAAPVTSVPRLSHLTSTLAAAGNLLAVTHRSRARAYVTTAPPGGAWRARRLPGSVLGTPSVAIAGGAVHVAYSRRWGRRSDVIHATLRAGRLRAERVTTHPDEDREPHLAAGPAGELFVGWTRGRGDRRYAMLARIF